MAKRDIASMMKRMKEGSYTKDLNQKINDQNTKFSKDERLWALTRDKDTGKGEAVIRFLPPYNDGDLPFEKYYEHFMKKPDGRWIVAEACGRSFGKPCPLCERASRFYNSGDKEHYRLAKAKATYLFNILVIDDKACPENNGKVFMVKLGATVYNAIIGAMNSEFEDEARQPFDLYAGHNFIYRSRKDPAKGGQIAYDKSKFEDVLTPVAKTDAEIERIMEQMHDLKQYVKDAAAKWTNEQLEAKCREAFYDNDPGSSFSADTSATQPMKQSGGSAYAAPEADEEEDDDHVPFSSAGSKRDDVTEVPSKPAVEEDSSNSSDSDDEDDLAFFRNLA